MSCLASIDKLIIRPVYKAQFMKKQETIRLYYYHYFRVFGVYFNILILLTLGRNKKYKGRDPWYQDPSRLIFGLPVTK